MSAVKGVAELNAALEKLPVKMAEKVTKKALRLAANMVAKQVRFRAPVQSGRLKKAISVRVSRKYKLERNGRIGVIIRVRPGKKKTDLTGAYYASFVEYGFNHGSKQIGGREAVARGIVTREQYLQKRAYLDSKRRRGKRRAVSFRHGGKRVEGQYFVTNTFNALKNRAERTIIRHGAKAATEAVRELKL